MRTATALALPVPGDGQTESVQPTSDREGPSGLETDCLDHHGHTLADFMTHQRFRGPNDLRSILIFVTGQVSSSGLLI